MLTKNGDSDEYGYSDYGIGLEALHNFHDHIANVVKMLQFLVLI